MNINTYSIVAYDADENAWGIAVSSKFPAVGAIVPWAKANAGAVATQAFAKLGYGPDGLRLMAEGKSAAETLHLLLQDDDMRENRQVGLVDADGNAVAHTGNLCHEWAGHKIGDGYTVQGNLLAGEGVIESMSKAYVTAEGELADRLIVALRAGEIAGGDRRGKQSAAVLVVRANGGYGGDTDRYLDLRVDDHEEPVRRLSELVEMHHLYFQPPRKGNAVKIGNDVARELQSMMVKHGYMSGPINGVWDEVCQQAFWILIANENLEMRWTRENSGVIDRVALDYLRERLG